ncbi:hypothetical protein Tco_0321692 [Tanacetum coccineum]
MESLHLSFNNVVNAGLYNRIHIDDSLSLSHLFYADDVIFVGKWNLLNLSTIVNVLKWFYLDSGLKINLYKSKLMGIGIPHDVVASAARSIGCSTLHLPFKYLRVKVPKRVLSKMESIRRNFFNGVKNAQKKMYLICWNKILASKKNRAIYGVRGALDNPPSYSRPYMVSPRSDIEQERLLLLILNTSSVILPNIIDRWTWRLDSSGVFSVKSAREFIDDSFHPKTDVPTRWVKFISIKINIFAWRVSLDKLPARLNLSLRGLDTRLLFAYFVVLL